MVLTLAAGALSSMVGIAHSSAFRGSAIQVASGHMRVEDLRAVILDELMAALGHGNRVTEKRLADLEEALRPMYRALPKNEHGNLDHSTARYALHRLFVLRHGMYVKGLEPSGQGWAGAASPAEILDELVPAYVQDVFEQRLGGRGLGMHEVAILAATLEHLIHDEATGRLKAAYRAHKIPLERRIRKDEAERVVDTYMVLFLLGENGTALEPSAIKAKQDVIHKVYPTWPDSQKFTREVQESVIRTRAAEPAFTGGRLSFNASAQIVEEIVERYGRWQDTECKDLKGALMKLEDGSTGRVLLKDFYGKAMGGAWQFTESVAYLRELGALDESNPGRHSVIIPNYINSRSNCLASSSIFSVCCLNECERLLGSLEREIGAPEAEPERLAELAVQLPSATVQAPRTLSEELRGLLQEVASQNDGLVPLHGRLFGQWLHLAYPRECPYPHRSGTTNPMTADEWISERGGLAYQASADEMQRHIDGQHENATCSNASSCEEAASGATPGSKPLMWTAEEELIAPVPASRTGRWSPLCRKVASLMAVLSLAGALLRSLAPVLASRSQKGLALPFATKAHYC